MKFHLLCETLKVIFMGQIIRNLKFQVQIGNEIIILTSDTACKSKILASIFVKWSDIFLDNSKIAIIILVIFITVSFSGHSNAFCPQIFKK